jgi:predicted ATPase/class 3 adenylate cyclase/DNA-binding CsgD family transcriptional regulator
MSHRQVPRKEQHQPELAIALRVDSQIQRSCAENVRENADVRARAINETECIRWVRWGARRMAESLPIGTVTFLVADVEWSLRLRERDVSDAALARLDQLLAEVTRGHGGVQPGAQVSRDSFVTAFEHAPDAVACALDLQLAQLSPIRLRIGVHTGEARLRDDDSYCGPPVGRAAGLRDVANGGQTLVSGATRDLVSDWLPEGAWLADLGRHRLRDLSRPERVAQLCHPDLAVEFPPLRSLDTFTHNLPVQLTSFVGREPEMSEVRCLVLDNRIVSLIGAGGAGKSRLALQVAAEMAADFPGGAWQVDLAPVTDPAVVPIAVIRSIGLADEPGRSAAEALTGFMTDRQALLVLDSCEHLLDTCATLIENLVRGCPDLTILTTSREPIGVRGEAVWRIPSLSPDIEAVELFADRAQRARPGFTITPQNADAVTEICRRLDGMPLAIELAAARLRAFSPAELAAGLHDRFRLLTGGARTAVRRQQTLRASVDWSHALLTDPERTMFRRLACFAGEFDLEAALAVGSFGGLERHQALDQLALLVDKSLVVGQDVNQITRYRLLETIRQYALEKLGESGEAPETRGRHRDYYTQHATQLSLTNGVDGWTTEQLEADIDNLRTAFQWSLEQSDTDLALQLASSLQPLWLGRCRMQEGLSWFDAALRDTAGSQAAASPEVQVQALSDAAVLHSWTANPQQAAEYAQEAVALARQLGNRRLLGRTLAAAGCAAGYLADVGVPYFAEAAPLAREAGDVWTLAQILGWQTFAADMSGDFIAARAVGHEGLVLAEQTGNQTISRQCRCWLGWALIGAGELSDASAMLGDLVAEAEAARTPIWKMWGLSLGGEILATAGRPDEARAAGEASLAIAKDLGVAAYQTSGYTCLSSAALAAGDIPALRAACQAGLTCGEFPWNESLCLLRLAEADLAEGDPVLARQRAAAARNLAAQLNQKSTTSGAMLTCARVALACGNVEQAHDDACQALGWAQGVGFIIAIVEALELIASTVARPENTRRATRLLGAADAIRRRIGYVRYAIHQGSYDSAMTALRASLTAEEFDVAWSEGQALTLDEAVGYALRGRGPRNRPTTGWAALTPAERAVVRLVSEGFANNEIADLLFISPRTVQSHLTHIFTKLGVTSRVKLAHEASRQPQPQPR